MKKSELPNYFWLVRTPDDRLAVPTFWGLGPTFVLPDNKIPKLSQHYPLNENQTTIITSLLIFLTLLSFLVGTNRFILLLAWVLFLALLKPIIRFFCVMRFERVVTGECIKLSRWETYRIWMFSTHTGFYLIQLLSVFFIGLMLLSSILGSDPEMRIMHFLIGIAFAWQFILGILPIRGKIAEKLKVLEQINTRIAVRVPEFKVYYSSAGVYRDSADPDLSESEDEEIPETPGGMLF